jgi:outer membrane receptor protein involved in Fe transport
MLSVRARKLVPGLGRWEIGAAVSRFAGSFGQGVGDGLGLEAAFRYETADLKVAVPIGRHLISAGARVERTPYRYDLDPGGSFSSFLPSLEVDGSSRSYALFVEDRWRPAGGVDVRIGVRAEKLRGLAWSLLPRAGMAYEPVRGLQLSLAGGTYTQGFTSLRNEEAGLSSVVAYDLLIPADSVLPEGWDLTAGAAWAKDRWSIRIDGFLKRLRDLPVAPRESDPAHAPIYIPPESFTIGDARVRGLELAARGTVSDWDLNLTYRLQDEERTVEGETWTPRNHRLHRLMLSGRRPWGEGSLNATVSWMSGQPFTPVRSLVPGSEGFDASGRPGGRDWIAPLLQSHNSARLPGYLRLDVGVRRRWKWSIAGRDVDLEPYLSVMNVLNQKNVLWGEYEAGGAVELKFGPQLPVLPSVGVRFRF